MVDSLLALLSPSRLVASQDMLCDTRFQATRSAGLRNQIPTLCASLRSLVFAARIQHRQDHQVRQRKQPLIGLLPRCLIRANDKAEVPPARQTVEMLQANPRQGGSLRVRKDLLAWLDLDHAFALNHPSNPDSERAPEGAKSFLIFRSEHNSPNDFANLANPLTCRSVGLKFQISVG